MDLEQLQASSSLPSVDIAEQMAQVRQRFLEGLYHRGIELDALLALAEQDENPTPLLGRATEILHKIAGVARTVGFGELGVLAFAAEQEMRALPARISDEGAKEAAFSAVDAVAEEISRLLGHT